MRKALGKRPLREPKRKLEKNLNFEEICFNDWIELDKKWFKWQNFVSALLNLLIILPET